MRPVFIGGTGRSGSTTLRSILGAHPLLVAIPEELRVIVDPGGALDLKSALSDSWSPFAADHALHTFRGLLLSAATSSRVKRVLHDLMVRFGVSPRRYSNLSIADWFGNAYYHRRLDQLMTELTLGVTHGSWVGSPSWSYPSIMYETVPRPGEEVSRLLAGFFDDLYHHLDPVATYWVDDTPYNICHTDELISTFPGARLIHIYRDPREVVASYLDDERSTDDVMVITRRLLAVLARWRQQRDSLPAHRFMEISLESLVNDPKAGMTRILRFLGLEWAEGFDSPVSRLSRQDPGEGSWRRRLSPVQQQIIDRHLEPVVAELGYPAS